MSEYGYLNQPYVEDMIQRWLEHPLKPGTISHIFIEHDSWCPALHGTGYCICRPVVRPPKREELRRLKQFERQAEQRMKKEGGQ